jgi:hypothetical protein
MSCGGTVCEQLCGLPHRCAVRRKARVLHRRMQGAAVQHRPETCRLHRVLFGYGSPMHPDCGPLLPSAKLVSVMTARATCRGVSRTRWGSGPEDVADRRAIRCGMAAGRASRWRAPPGTTRPHQLAAKSSLFSGSAPEGGTETDERSHGRAVMNCVTPEAANPRGRSDRCIAGCGSCAHALGLFVVSEAEAAAIRAVFEREGEFAAAGELRRLFPGVTDTTEARECARTIAGWKPLPLQHLRPEKRR